MATTISQSRIARRLLVTSISMTSANAEVTFTLPACRALSIQAEAVTTGTVSLTRSNDGTTFYALATPVSFATADGQTTVPVADLAARTWKVSQTGSSSCDVTIVAMEQD